MNSAKKLSVIMPVYNNEKYLAAAIDSILAQSFVDFELIIVNDCSIDASASIIAKYALCDQRIVVINNDRNLGLAGARNEALKVAGGEYLAFQDSDDISMPSRFAKQCAFLDSHSDYFLVGSRVISFGAAPDKVIGRLGSNDYLKSLLFFLNPFITSSVMLRNFNLHKDPAHYLLFDLNSTPSEDYSLWLNLFSYGKFYNLAEPLALYRLHAEQTSHSLVMQQKIRSAIIDTQRQFFKTLQISCSEDELFVNATIASNDYSGLSGQHLHIMSSWLSHLDKFVKNKDFGFFKSDLKIFQKVIGHVWYVYLVSTGCEQALFKALISSHHLSFWAKIKLCVRFYIRFFRNF